MLVQTIQQCRLSVCILNVSFFFFTISFNKPTYTFYSESNRVYILPFLSIQTTGISNLLLKSHIRCFYTILTFSYRQLIVCATPLKTKTSNISKNRTPNKLDVHFNLLSCHYRDDDFTRNMVNVHLYRSIHCMNFCISFIMNDLSISVSQIK